MSVAFPLSRHALTVDEYHRMADAGILRAGDRVELIEGEIIDMSPIGSDHASVVNRLISLMVRAVGISAIVSAQNPIHLNDLSEPQPDLALLRYRDDYYRAALPGAADVLLVVEVADSSLRYDREIKLPLYARHAIPEVWIVDLEQRRLEIHLRPAGDTYLEKRCPDLAAPIAPTALADCPLDLGKLW